MLASSETQRGRLHCGIASRGGLREVFPQGSDQFCSDSAAWVEYVGNHIEGEFKTVTEMRQHSTARQKSRYFGLIALALIIATGLCWGFAHI
jgi:hypothetical protein